MEHNFSDAQLARIDKLKNRLEELLASALPKNPADNEAEINEALQVRKELEAMGFLVTYKASASISERASDPVRMHVMVTLWLPKPIDGAPN